MNNRPQDVHISDYTYNLPVERIARFPLKERDQSKLLVYRNGDIIDDHFYHFANHIPGNSTLVLNNTRVIEARILFQKPSGGQIEIFCLEPHQQNVETSLQQTGSAEWQCLIGGASKWKPGQVLEKELAIGKSTVLLTARYIGKQSDSFLIRFSWEADITFSEIIHAAGNIPLPPYIKRPVTEDDSERYQTVFSRFEGSVAAPTASLHFTPQTFEDLKQKNTDVQYITLHVGAGTFKRVKTATIGDHQMHQEPFTVRKEVLQKLVDSGIITVSGTTSLRTLESLYWTGIKLINNHPGDACSLQQWELYELDKKYPPVHYKESLQAVIKKMNDEGLMELHCRTSMVIVPGYQVRIPDALVTNFHQPQSTLLLLVAAFIGEDWKKVYDHALKNDYRFLSYGDSSLLWKV